MPLYVNVQGRQPQRKSLETLLILHVLAPNRAGSFMGRQDNDQFKGALADRPNNLGKRTSCRRNFTYLNKYSARYLLRLSQGHGSPEHDP
jgi:hypothetical protein